VSRFLIRLSLGVLLLAVATVVACSLFLPERYAVNVPLWGTLLGADPPEPATLERRIALPGGFRIGVFAEGLSNPRFLRFTETGDLLVSSPRENAIFLLEPDEDGDGRSDGRRTLVAGLRTPHGLDLFEGWLYLGETDRLQRRRFDARTREVGSAEVLVGGLPGGGRHFTRTVRVGPDRRLYVSVGSSCNVCEEADPRRAAIVRYALDGSGEEIHASGLRNSVGFDWRPGTEELYAVDNGRDLLGDDFPPEELNRIVAGGFYGWPYAHGDRVPDPEYGARHPDRVRSSVVPVHAMTAHSAPLGIHFYRGRALPERYRAAAFVAQHGSWNRTRKSGYRVVALFWDASGAIREEDFAVGFERDEDVIGRPVDLTEGPDGALYLSDDYAGAIYRIAYGD
jgi:glucose/arabinose dehydrogenase